MRAILYAAIAFLSYLVGQNAGFTQGYNLVRDRGVELRIVQCPLPTEASK